MNDKNQKTSKSSNRRTSSRWFNFSYTTRVGLAFALIATMTALIAFGVLSVVWQQHFHTYTSENIQQVATNAASEIGKRYETNRAWGSDTLRPAEAATRFSPSIGVQVADHAGSIVYDSTRQGGRQDPSLLPFDADSIAQAPIVVEGETVGTVRTWVYGSSTLLTQTDLEFRNKSYQAMVLASGLAVLLAVLIGIPFARGLVNPINRISRAAKAFGEGDLGARTQLAGDDEIAKLGQTFDAMAESVEKDRELEHRLTTDVAHELRTPLMAIQSTVEAMIDGVFDADEERLGTLNSEVQRLSRLVDAILKLSRLENRTTPLKQEIVDVQGLISGLVATHEAFVQEAGLELHSSFEPDVYVYGDSDLIRQAAANLISNAVRYTPEGSITVSVFKDKEWAYIAVQDTGIGLSEDDAKMVFSRFWRADSGRTRETGGLGVGLALVKEILDQHGGHVDVEGELGKGSIFTLAFPLYNEENEREVRRRLRNESHRLERSFDDAWDEDEL